MIVCVGATPAVQRTLVFERLRVGEVNRAAEVRQTAAGKGINVARVLTALGREAMATGFVGGERGAFLERELDRDGVGHRFVHVRDETRICTTVLERATGGHTELVEEAGAVGADDWQRMGQVYRELIRGARLAALSGSVPAGGPDDFYLECCRAAAEAGIGTIVDARGALLTRALEGRPAVAKMNREELAATVGRGLEGERDILAAIRELGERGARWVVVTMGAAGAVVWDRRRAWRIGTPRVKTVNSIGSGDAFTAGMAAAMLDGAEAEEACRLGAACGAANALTLTSAEVRPADVRRLAGEVTVEAIE